MSKIDELLKNEKVEWKKLGGVANCFAGGTPKTGVSKYYDGDIPWIRSGEINFNIIKKSQRNITEEGLNNSSAKMIRKNSVVIAMTGATVGRIGVVEFETSCNQSVAAIETDEKILYYKYLYYYLSKEYLSIKNMGQGALTSLNLSIIKSLEIPIPPLETQEKIVKILDKFTNYVTELQSELQSRTKQYNYYRDKLLSEEYLNEISNKLEGLENKKEISWNKISNICLRQKGINITAGEMKELNKIGALVRIFAGGNTIADVDEEDVGKDNVIKKDSIIVKSRGNIDFEFYDKPFSHKNELWSYSSLNKEILNIKFLYYYLKSNLQYFRDSAISGKLPQISIGNTDNYKVPLPHIDIQNKIVEILDKFQELLKDTKGLLPQEIEQRQKQYEYYREKLLTFDEKCGNTHTHTHTHTQ